MPRVVQVIPMDGIGGVEVAAHSMSQRRGLDIDFEVIFVASDRRKVNSPLAYASALRRILGAKPDVLICSLWRAAPIGVLAKLMMPQIKLVSFLHDTVPAHRLDGLFITTIEKFADQVWVDSSSTATSRVSAARRNQTRVVSFVLDRLPRVKSDRPEYSFVSWCRLNKQKGIDRSIRFIADLRRRGLPATYDIWGPDGGAESSLKMLCDDLGISEFVRFCGSTSRKDLPRIAAQHSFYLQLSRHEGMAMAVVEAMQLGLVPIVTPAGEIPSYCQHRLNAIVVDPERLNDAADALIGVVDGAHFTCYSDMAAQHWEKTRLYHEVVSAYAAELAGG